MKQTIVKKEALNRKEQLKAEESADQRRAFRKRGLGLGKSRAALKISQAWAPSVLQVSEHFSRPDPGRGGAGRDRQQPSSLVQAETHERGREVCACYQGFKEALAAAAANQQRARAAAYPLAPLTSHARRVRAAADPAFFRRGLRTRGSRPQPPNCCPVLLV